MTLTLLQNAALLLALCWLLGFTLHHRVNRHPTANNILTGLWFGGVCVVGMLVPFTLQPGVIYDSRAVVLSMAGLFGGPLAAAIAAIIAGSYRLWLGGAGSYIGLFNIAMPVLLGLGFRLGHKRGLWRIGFWPLLGLGLILHAVALISMLALPSVTSLSTGQLALPALLIMPLATVMIGLLLDDLARHHHAEQALQASEARLSAITRAIPDLLLVIDEDGHYMEIVSSDSNQQFSGCKALSGQSLPQALRQEDTERFMTLIEQALTSNTPLTLEFPYQTEEGLKFYDVHAQRLETPTDSKRAVVAILRDITERKTAEGRVQQLAFYDPLTTLPNRRLLLDRLQQALATSARRGCHGALMFIDLDNFKHINDAYGHPVGDLFLQQAAQRLHTSVRGSDTVARLGGDEFVVMLEELDSQPESAAEQARQIGDKLLATLAEPYPLEGQMLHSSGSIGIALFCGAGVNPDELMKRADLSMYEAKNNGKNALRFYDSSKLDNMQQRLEPEGGQQQPEVCL